MKKFELIPASRATRNGTNKTSSSGDENDLSTDLRRIYFTEILFILQFSLLSMGCMTQIKQREQYKNYKEQFYRTKLKSSAKASDKSCC